MQRFVALALLAMIAAPRAAHAAPDGVEDRYGPPAAPFAEPGQAAAMPLLVWPGKTAAVAGLATPAATYPSPRPVAALPTSLYARAPEPAPAPPAPASSVRAAWAAVSPPITSPQPSAAQGLPPPPSPLAQVRPAATPPATDGQPPRFYSLHREFGLTPDPTPLPAQFFAGNQDLAEPPPPPPPRVLPAGQAAMTASARAQASAQDPDAPAASQPN